jgi:ubiquinol-cytochrome c reductase cytochrome b subunit
VSRLTKLSFWLEERIGHKALLHELLDEPVVGGARWAYVFGSALTLVFAMQAVTGVLLMTSYAPSAQTAWASVHYITFSLSGGWLVRGMHHFGSQAMVVLLGLHLFQVATFGAYKRPREVNWWLGLALMGVTLGFALTGYLLPWDQKGYWATRVATNIAGTTPLVGTWVQQLLQGGPEYGSLTLTRFYALHVGVLPASLAFLLAAHIALFRKHGVTPPVNADRTKVDAFYPKQVWKDLVVALAVVGVVMLLAMREHGAPIDAPADPASDYPARPEWYFLSLFQLLKYFEGPLEVVGTILLPAVAAGYLLLLPILDRKPTTALGPRAGLLLPLAVGGLGLVWLTWASVRSDAADARFQASRRVADARAVVAVNLARQGVPPQGPLEMLRHDPELHGADLFEKKCAGCHVLGNLGDEKKASAPKLDGWGTTAWVLAMVHEPDGDARFGRTPYKGQMPSVDTPPKDRKGDEPPFKPMSRDDMLAVATFLAAEGDAPGDPPGNGRGDEESRKRGEKIVGERCTTCHLWKGEGDDGDQGLAPELSGYGSLAWVRAQVTNPATKVTYREKAVDDKDEKGHMPRFDQELTPEDIDTVARWTRAHARGIPLGTEASTRKP